MDEFSSHLENLNSSKMPEALGIQILRAQNLIGKIGVGVVQQSTAEYLLRDLFDRIKPYLSGGSTQEFCNAETYLIDLFLQSAPDALDEFEMYALEYEKGIQEAVIPILRILHNLKGELACLGMEKMTYMIHAHEEEWKNSPNVDQTLEFIAWLRLCMFNMASRQDVSWDTGSMPDRLLKKFQGELDSTELSNTFQITDPPMVKLQQYSVQAEFEKNENPQIQNNDFAAETLLHSNLKLCKNPIQQIFNQEELDLIPDFLVESQDLVLQFEKAILDISDNRNVEKAINEAFRACHTIKGLAGFLKLHDLREITHEVETAMDWVRTGLAQIQKHHLTALFQSVDLIQDQLNQVTNLINQGTPLIQNPDFKEFLQVFSKHNFLSLKNSSEASCDSENIIIESIPNQNVNNSSEPGSEIRGEVGSNKLSETQMDETMRVPVTKLDQLIDAIGEAVISQSMIVADPVISHLLTPVTRSQREELRRKVIRAEQVMRQIQEFSMALRMVTVSGVFQKVTRIIRDLSRKLDKVVHLEVEGEHTTLDKSLVENLVGPLVHMARNSMDHGIETEHERMASGKDPVAKVTLKAYHRAGQVYIELSDDGRGLNCEKIVAKALEKGLIQEGKSLEVKDVWQLIFHPGFSTASQVTELSGRGVGMDVVKQSVVAMRGAIDIQSEWGKGTTFTIRLPLTLAIIDGMVVRVVDELYVIPTLSIISSQKIDPNHYNTIKGQGEILDIRGRSIRMLRLNQIVGLDIPLEDASVDAKESLCQGVVIVVEDASGAQVGIYTDEILGQQQVVIKNLGALTEVPGIAGGTIMNDGKVCLILDINALVKCN